MVKRPRGFDQAKAIPQAEAVAEAVGQNEEFVRALYIGMLNWDADPGGLETYMSKLANGSMSKPDLVRVFVRSEEFRQKYLMSDT